MTIKQQYRRERRRIQQWVRRAEKSGFVFPEPAIPKIPKKITEGSIRRLQKLQPETLAKKALYVTPTGEVVSGTEGLTRRRTDAPVRKEYDARKGAIENLYGVIESYKDTGDPEDIKSAEELKGMLDGVVAREGVGAVGQHVLDHFAELADNVRVFIRYRTESVRAAAKARLRAFLEDRAITAGEGVSENDVRTSE